MKNKFSMRHLFLISLLASVHAFSFSQESATKTRVISADVNQVKGSFNTMFKESIGAGRANEGLRADWQQQLAMLKKDCDFKYIRMHGLLCDDMGFFSIDQKGNPVYNYQYIDVLYDYLLSIGIKPFVELGFMPQALASGNKTIFWWRGNVTPPYDYDKWANLIRHLVQHFTDRYGIEEVKTWYFEVWNEPNLFDGFWTGTQDDYFKLYQYTANAIKTVNPLYRVGGPATAGAAWVPEMIEFCDKNQVPIDFISTHAYGVQQGYLDEFGTSGTVLDKNLNAVSDVVLNSRKQIEQSTKPNLELHYTEWSSSYTPADPVHDSYHQAAYILHTLKQVGNAPNSMPYWVFTDIFEESGPRFTPFHGGFGLLNYQGIKKSAYHAYSFLNKLSSTELMNTDTASWICKDDKNNVQCLLWDCTYTLPDSTNNQTYYIQNLPAKAIGNVTVAIKGLQKGSYNLEIYQIGYKMNDPHTYYVELGRPNQLTKNQVEKMKQLSSGEPILSEIIKINSQGTFEKSLPMRENEVYFIRLSKR